LSTRVAPDILASIPIFEGLCGEQLARLSGQLRGCAYPAGATVFSMEQPGEAAYVILDGTVKIRLEQHDGTELLLGIMRAGEIVGEMSLIDDLGRSASVVTMEDSYLAAMPRSIFWECLRTMPGMTFNLVGILSRRLRLANAQVQSLADQDVSGRVARQLLALAEEFGEADPAGGVRIPIRLTQSDIAALVSASRVRVNQVLVEHRRLGLLSVDDQHRITIRDRARLAEQCPP
jgi:CRP/FNR family cyclic AMP-dependent transcriptional regulator